MALFSSDKVNLFNNTMLELLEYLVTASKHNATELNSEYVAYVIDRMIVQEPLDFRKNPELSLLQVFRRFAEDKDIRNDFMQSKTNINSLRQRRLFVTPTLDYYQPCHEDETNLVLRKYMNESYRFVRVSFLNDNLEKGYYFQECMNWILGYIHSVLVYGVRMGNYVHTFLSYSNSQLKNHSWWMLTHTIEDLPAASHSYLTEKLIIDGVGDFTKEKNILKRYARRG